MTFTKHLIATIVLLAPLSCLASPLSRDQIVQLHAAGIGDSTIAHQVQRSGITFDPDATSSLALRNAGLSDTVLDAIIQAGSSTAKPTGTAPAPDQVTELYKAKSMPRVPIWS